MEFYQTLHKNLNAHFIQQNLRLDNLHQYCDFITSIINSHEDKGEIYCDWGLFNVQREIIKKGIRISLLNCPNALTFTITKEEQGIVLHCTINTSKPDQDFIDSIELFLTDLKNGIAEL
ncbi:MAG: hypothetical protein OQK72_10085 [Gammaproteobacteria bacterium]|nr:hypothetical protein [Gammaproteobacteria bacterium]